MPTYPLHLIAAEQIEGCGQVIVRPVWRQDQHILATFFAQLSQTSRTQRFLSARKEISPSLLEMLVDVDYESHFALLAVFSRDEQEQVVAEARVTHADNPDEWEFALCVAEQWRQKGLGERMLRRVLRGANVPATSIIYGEAYATNTPMIRLARSLGFSVERRSTEVRFSLAASRRRASLMSLRPDAFADLRSGCA